MRREKYAKNKVTGSRIYYFNGVRHGVRNDLLQHCTEHGEYYGAAEPPVRCGESHLSGLTEPLRSL